MFLIVGAGYAGLGVAKAFAERGLDFEVVERNSELGGNWLNGVYDNTHIISSRDTTAYSDFPMPGDYPDFPSRAQVLAYLNSYADHFQLRRRIRFNTELTSLRPLGKDGMESWEATFADGTTRRYEAAVVCNGHHWDKRYGHYDGTFTGKSLHSKDYKNASDFAEGPVLVVGAGNSGCDVAVEASRDGHPTFISMRRGYYFLPKTLFGIPTAELDIPYVPMWLYRPAIKAMLRLTVGSNKRYGLPEPEDDLFDRHPIVNSDLLQTIRHGKIQPKPDIARLDGDRVHFVDGTSEQISTIVWATGFNVSFPFLDRDLFDWDHGVPKRVAGTMVPGVANLYVFGLLQPRGGAGPLISAGAEMLGDFVIAQRDLDVPLSDLIARFEKPSAKMLVGVSETLRRIKRGRRLLPLMVSWHRFRGGRRRLPSREAA